MSNKFLSLHFSPKSITPTAVRSTPDPIRHSTSALPAAIQQCCMAENRCKPLGKPLQCEVQAARLPSDRRNVLYCATSIAIFSLCHIKIFLLVYWFVLPKLSADKSLWVHDLWAKRARAQTPINKQIENLRQLFSVFLFSVFCSPLSYNFLVKFTNGTNKFSHFSLPAIQIWPGSEL